MNEKTEKAIDGYGEECAVAGEMVGYKNKDDSSYVRATRAALVEAIEEEAESET